MCQTGNFFLYTIGITKIIAEQTPLVEYTLYMLTGTWWGRRERRGAV